MPLVADDIVPMGLTQPREADAARDDPGTLDTIKSAGVDANWVYRGYRFAQNRAFMEPAVPGYNPLDDIKGTKYEIDPERFAHSSNPQETEIIKREWDQDGDAADVLSRSGWTGTVAGVGMGLLDPTIFMPIGKVFTGVKEGYRSLRIAGDTALAGAESAIIGETVMYQTKPDYTFADVAQNVGTATLLSGLIGFGAGALLSRTERKALESQLTADRQEWGAEYERLQPQPGGASVSDTRQLELDTPEFLKSVPDITSKFSPPRRVLNAPFLSARRAVADLVETPYIFKENAEGVATTQGPALDRHHRMMVERNRVEVAEGLDRLYSAYKLEAAPTAGEVVEKASFSQFKEMIDDALRADDKHQIPQVAEAARLFRERVIAPARDEAIDAGLLPEGVEAKTADSYMMRLYNKTKIVARRPDFINRIVGWLEGQEDTKLALKEKVSRDTSSLDNTAAVMKDLQARIDKRTAALDEIEARQEEMTSLNRAAYLRANKMRESAPHGLDVLRTEGQKNNARGGAVFETKIRDRGNALADRASAKDAEILDLQRRLDEFTAKHDKLRADLENSITAWEGKSTREAKAALKERERLELERAEQIKTGSYKGRNARLASADDAVDRAARIIADRDFRDRKELLDLANEITNRILGGPDGRLPYDAATGGPQTGVPKMDQARGPLASREFMIPDEMISDFLDKDVQTTLDLYSKTMWADVLLTKKFGDVDMTEVFRKLNDEADQLAAAAKNEKARNKIHAQRDSTIATLAGMRDRIRGTLGFSADPALRNAGRIAATVSKFDVMTNLGSATLSSLTDMAGAQWRYGFASVFQHAWKPLLTALNDPAARAALSKGKKELRLMGIATDTFLKMKTSSLGDMSDIYRPTSKFERAVSWGTDKFSVINLLAPWTDGLKFISGMTSMGAISDNVAAVVEGKASKKQVRQLAEAGIDGVMADRIAKAMDKPGGVDALGGYRIPNTDNWTDRGAALAFQGAVARDADIMVLTPGAEKPLMMTSSPAMKLILQYKSFVAAANERLMVRSMMQRDAQVLQGLVSAIGFGMLAELSTGIASGKELPTTTADWVKAGVNRSGVLGWYSEANAMSAKIFGANADAFTYMGASKPDARYLSRSKLAALLGPTAGKLEAIMKVGSKAASAKWSAGDTRAVRRLLILQNHFLIRRLLDKLEANVNEAFGVAPLKD